MKVAAITPYHTEPVDVLRRAHDSVMAQSHACTHYMVADGHARSEIEEWDLRHIRLPAEHCNNGNTPRAIGSLDAVGAGFDVIAFLDADNWFEADHIESLLSLHQETGAGLLTSGRVIHAIDGSVLLPNGEQGDGTDTADTSTMLFTRPAFSALTLWGTMPNELGPNCDRFVFKGAQALGCSHRHRAAPTVHFTSRYGPHYRAAGQDVPAEANAMHTMKESDQFVRRLTSKGLSHILSGRDAESWFGTQRSEPYIVFVVGGGSQLDSKQKKFCDGLIEALAPNGERHYTTAENLVSGTDLTAGHNNVFAVYFETAASDRQTMETVAETRGDIAVLYVRSNTSSHKDVDTALDRRAWKIVVESEDLHERYRQERRYGNGHVFVGAPIKVISPIVDAMHQYAR